MEVALRHGDERIWVKKFWSKLFVISESFESLILMCFTRNGDVIMGVNERNLFLILKKILKSSSEKESIQRSARQNPKVLVCYGVLNKITLYRALELLADFK